MAVLTPEMIDEILKSTGANQAAAARIGAAPPPPSSFPPRTTPVAISPEGELARRNLAQQVARGAVPSVAPGPVQAPTVPSVSTPGGVSARLSSAAKSLNPNITGGNLGAVARASLAGYVPIAAATAINTQDQREVGDIQTRGGFGASIAGDVGDALTFGRASAVGRAIADRIGGADNPVSFFDAIVHGTGSDQERLNPLPPPVIQQPETVPAAPPASLGGDSPISTPAQLDSVPIPANPSIKSPMQAYINEILLNAALPQGPKGASIAANPYAPQAQQPALADNTLQAAALKALNDNIQAADSPQAKLGAQAAALSLQQAQLGANQSRRLDTLYGAALDPNQSAASRAQALRTIQALTGKGASADKAEIKIVPGLTGVNDAYYTDPANATVTKLNIRDQGRLFTDGKGGFFVNDASGKPRPATPNELAQARAQGLVK